MSWSPFRPDVMADPAVGHHELLDRCPVHHYTEFDPPFYTLSKFTDVEMALRDTETFSSEFGQGPRFTPPQGMLSDPPQHTHLRSLIQSAFAPRAMKQLAPQVQALTYSLLADLGETTFDLHDQFAFPLPVVIIAGMLGVPKTDLEQFKHWSDVRVAAMGAPDPSQYLADINAFDDYMLERLTEREAALNDNQTVPDDLLTLIAAAQYPDGKPVDRADKLSMISQLLVGGNETTTSLITNVVWRLLQFDLWSQVVNNPDLIEAAIEESLRYDPPVLGLYRNTTRDVTLHGVDIPKGSKVLINYAAANRDPAAFDAPDEFQLTRGSRRHMSFGLGLHFCLGAPMARLETRIALQALCEHYPNLQLVDAGERIAPFFLWGRKRLWLKAS